MPNACASQNYESDTHGTNKIEYDVTWDLPMTHMGLTHDSHGIQIRVLARLRPRLNIHHT